MNDLITNTFPVFKGKTIRRLLHRNEWWFSVIDVIEALTESPRARKYWSELKQKLMEEEGFFELSEKIGQLKLESADGKKYETDCATAETLFRIIQSVPSPKAEPFNRWLARHCRQILTVAGFAGFFAAGQDGISMTFGR